MASEGATESRSRNQAWNRDELILALFLYLQTRPKDLAVTDPRVVELSRVLNSLPSAQSARDPSKFRNANGVKMKCANFKRFDPSYTGKGLQRGNHLEEVVWNEFAHDPKRLAAVAAAIRSGAAEAVQATVTPEPEEETEFAEGGVLTALHKRRERDPKASAKKKSAVLKAQGRLACEACGFDFVAVYGELGVGFAECHHRQPLASLPERHKTTMSDLAILCANCHRMIHRTRPLMTVEAFSRLVKK
jgi:5-methylcytosine-specific restriction protein A